MRCRIGELCLRIGSGGTPSRRKNEYYENGTIRWLKTKELEDTTIYDTEEYITEEALKSSSAKLFPKNTITIAMYGATVGKLGILKEEMATNQACCNMVVDKEKCDYRFLYYSLLINRDKLINLANGAAQQNLNKAVIENFEINIFPIEEQRKIADTLWSLDKKIQLNNDMNKTLEEMAQALFKRWFIDFEFPNEDGEPYKSSGGEMVKSELGIIPIGWSISELDNCCSLIAKGITPKYTEISDQIVINQKCIRDGKINLKLARFHIPKKINDKWLKRGDILINSTGQGTLGRVAQFIENYENLVVDSHVTIVRPNKEEFIHYLGCLLATKQCVFEGMASGSTGQTDLPRGLVKAMKIVIPPKCILEKFADLVNPIREKIIMLQNENVELEQLRDSLLPKLMSGEIRVEDIEANL